MRSYEYELYCGVIPRYETELKQVDGEPELQRKRISTLYRFVLSRPMLEKLGTCSNLLMLPGRTL